MSHLLGLLRSHPFVALKISHLGEALSSGQTGMFNLVDNCLGLISSSILHHLNLVKIIEKTVWWMLRLTPDTHFIPVFSHLFATVWLEVKMSRPIWVKKTLRKIC